MELLLSGLGCNNEVPQRENLYPQVQFYFLSVTKCDYVKIIQQARKFSISNEYVFNLVYSKTGGLLFYWCKDLQVEVVTLLDWHM